MKNANAKPSKIYKTMCRQFFNIFTKNFLFMAILILKLPSIF